MRSEEENVARAEEERTYIPVVARISTHSLRVEREYHLCKSFMQNADPDCLHTVRLLDLVRLPSQQEDEETLILSIFESPGRNYLKGLLDFGPAWLRHKKFPGDQDLSENDVPRPQNQVPLSTFLDFAIGACECLELLHHGLRVVHGELRGDAFHFNQDNGAVKLINFGSGPRSFENGLTSRGWITLSRELGVKHKLQYVAPEQTGRMPAEPDSRTDLYSLGVLFWTMLTGKSAFEGETPIDIIQAVLGRRIPLVSSERLDIPDVISKIIQKMTQKQIDERYHSTSGLRYDLVAVQKILGEGDAEALEEFSIASKDVPSFFMLPTNVLGRTGEHGRIVEVIEKIARRQHVSQETGGLGVYSYGSNSASTISERFDGLENATRSSDTSSVVGRDCESPALGLSNSGTAASQDPVSRSHGLSNGTAPTSKPPLEVSQSQESVDTAVSLDTQRSSSGLRPNHSGQHHASSSIPRRRESHKSRRRHRCEVISILGAAGLGKTSLVQSAQADIRRLGYFASAKFDPARKAPFEPLIHAMGSLFRQVFSESDVSSVYHNTVRKHIRGFWPSVSSMLDLPESLISAESQHLNRTSAFASQQGHNKSLKAEMSDGSNARASQAGTPGTASQITSESLRGGANTRSMKFITIFVEILRILSTNKMICLCLDDIQFADEESLDVISSIIDKKLGIIVITTCRDEGTLPAPVERVVSNVAANVTTIRLSPLGEQEVVDYVAATMYRDREYVTPLAVVCLEKSNGNPFYLRQMLEVCHRKSCIWYSWKESMWEYDLDRVFAEFESDSYGQQLNTNFVTKRLQDLPPAARSILAWASLLGTTFSFMLIQRLLSGEFDYAENEEEQSATCTQVAELFTPQPVENVVQGLQATLQAYIIMPGSREDEFTFSHDRYVQASASLRECHDVEKMHFIIVQTTMKHSSLDERSLYNRAQHICRSANVINRRVRNRHRFRVLLLEAAEKAIESGARPTALEHCEACLSLMQPEPWKQGAQDVYYEETLNLYTRTAELYWHQGRPVEAQNLLDSIFAGARTPSDKSPAWILQSRLFGQAGNMAGAFTALKTSLLELGLDFAATPTWALCDAELSELRKPLQVVSFSDIVSKPMNDDPNVTSMGAVLVEATSAAFWSNTLLFYQLTLKMVKLHLTNSGTFPQIGLGFSYFAMVCISRSEDPSFGLQMYDVSTQLLSQCQDSYTIGRGLAVSALFVQHLLSPLRSHANVLEEAIDHALVSGDKHVSLLSTGCIALRRLYSGDDMADIESFCTIATEDFGDWASDMRGGVFLTATRQVARSLQGKTWIHSADTVMSDDNHITADYMNLILSRASNAERWVQ